MLAEAPSVFQSQISNHKNKTLITIFVEPRTLNTPMYMRFLSDTATKLINDSSIWPAFIHLLFPVT